MILPITTLTKTKKKLTANINNEFKDRVKTNNVIKNDEVNVVKIKDDGNCFYREISLFLLGSQEFYMGTKNMIIDWIEKNFQLSEEFFNDDEINNLIQTELALNELQYIKEENSWG